MFCKGLQHSNLVAEIDLILYSVPSQFQVLSKLFEVYRPSELICFWWNLEFKPSLKFFTSQLSSNKNPNLIIFYTKNYCSKWLQNEGEYWFGSGTEGVFVAMACFCFEKKSKTHKAPLDIKLNEYGPKCHETNWIYLESCECAQVEAFLFG